jgi:hypothetical protein
MYQEVRMTKKNGEWGEWKAKQSEVNGYVRGKLESIEGDVKEIRKHAAQLTFRIGGIVVGGSIIVSIILNALL